ncbi:hypothetical protein PRK78_004959 [Emydomyces testavorans]|uniref:BTB domain-containing protein n=1 Tax=Emydomyces testavorans TaxID=2070801 RepID=A0AAF0IJ26_9EURO|nr:hypothetical protein PRK78_004959 [Emydomyces testavorans]
MAKQTSSYEGFSQLLKSGQYSDLKIVCNGEVFKVHKAIVCPQSPVIAAAVNGEFQEATTGIITSDAFDIKTVRRMIEFMYMQKYSRDVEEEVDHQPGINIAEANQGKWQMLDRGAFELRLVFGVGLSKMSLEGEPTDDENTAEESWGDNTKLSLSASNEKPAEAVNVLIDHVHVNAIADYYDVPGLRELANDNIRAILVGAWSADGFVGVANEVFNCTGDKALRGIIAETITSQICDLVYQDDFADLKMEGETAVEVIREMGKDYAAAVNHIKYQESELQTAWNLLGNEQKRYECVMTNIRKCLNTLKNTAHCSNWCCDARFTCYIEEYGPSREPMFRLCCASCQCKTTTNSDETRLE